MKALSALACLIALAAVSGPAAAEVRDGYWIIEGPKVGGRSEAWSTCRALVRQRSPIYKLYRVQIQSTGRVRCYYTS